MDDQFKLAKDKTEKRLLGFSVLSLANLN